MVAVRRGPTTVTSTWFDWKNEVCVLSTPPRFEITLPTAVPGLMATWNESVKGPEFAAKLAAVHTTAFWAALYAPTNGPVLTMPPAKAVSGGMGSTMRTFVSAVPPELRTVRP